MNTYRVAIVVTVEELEVLANHYAKGMQDETAHWHEEDFLQKKRLKKAAERYAEIVDELERARETIAELEELGKEGTAAETE